MVEDPRFHTFGEIAQRANPQQADPQQNKGVMGFPTPKRFSGRKLQDKRGLLGASGSMTGAPISGGGTAAALGPNAGGLAPAPGVSNSISGPGGLPDQGPAFKLRDKRQQQRFTDIMNNQPQTSAEVEAAAAAQAEASGIQPVGKYGEGGYQPVAGNDLWGGGGLSGADPREAGTGDPTAITKEAKIPDPGAQGGKGGATTGNPAADAAAAPFVPGGAQGAKGGQPPGAGAPGAPAPGTKEGEREPGSNIVPAGDIGNQ